MKTLITQSHNSVRRLGARWLTALVTFCCCCIVAPSFAQTWQIGTGTTMWSQTSTIPAPLGHYAGSGRTQWMWTKAELLAAGLTANTMIHQFAFKVGALQNAQGANNSAAPNCQLQMQQTTLANLNSSNFINSGWTVTINGTFEPALGWNTFNIPAGFQWDGNQNIVIDFCYSSNYSTGSSSYYPGNGNAGVYYTTAPSGGPWGVYAYNNTGTNLCGTTNSPTTTTQRPNIRFSSMLPCVGVTQKGNLNYPATTTGLCPGTRVALIDTNYGTNLNMSFQWCSGPSANGPWTGIPGATSDRYTIPPLTSTVYYCLAQQCSFGGRDTTSKVGFTVANPVTWATIPYFESFESWSSGCGTNDKVSASWTNIPFTGNASRRRDDQGSSASWGGTSASIKAKDGSYSSRFNYFHGNGSVPMTTGNEFSLHLDCSGTTGTKELQFWYAFKFTTAGDFDSLTVEYSQDSGRNWAYMSATTARMNNFFGTPGQWNYATYALPSNSPKTIVRWRSRLKAYSAATDHDIYLDAVRVVPPCTAKPTAGKIDSALACAGQSVTLYTSGTSQAAGLTYLWQWRPSGSNTAWSAMPAGNGPSVTTTMGTTPQDVRVIVGCGNTTPVLYDTTPVFILRPAPFYYCYCGITITYTQYSYVEVGNVTLVRESNKDTLLYNGNPLPVVGGTNANNKAYEDFRQTVPAPTLILDSTYRLWLSQIAGYSFFTSTYATAWIDFNRNGTFDAGEKIVNDRGIASSANPFANGVFKVPANAGIGLTGLRTAITYYTTPVLPCGNVNYYGQVEDYLVRIEYQPCTGPASAGITYQSDTSICPGYTVDLWNTTYQKDRTGINRMWEVSTNNGASFNAIAGSANKDSMINLVVGQATSSKYRLRLICSGSNDTTYSNVVTVTTPAPYRCYPTAWASFGAKDSSDIGSVIIGNRVFPATGAGPHLLNPLATKRRTDWTLEPPIELHADSTYRLAVFHTMPRAWHADALVSVFFDYNNDGDYDVAVPGPPFTSELAMQGVSDKDSFFLDTKIKIPSAVIPNVPTGMRVVLNNDLNPNGSGNTGIGAFTSGEVEDYVVIFRRVNLGVNGNTLMNTVALYPNPTQGRFTVLNDAVRPVSHMDIVVTTVSGQEVIRRSFDNAGSSFKTELDLSNQAKGIYFVEIRADGEKVTKKLIVR